MHVSSRAFAAVLVVTGNVALFAACSSSSDAGGGTAAPAATTPAATKDAAAGDATDAAEESMFFVPPPMCTSFTYSDWSACRFDSTEVRTVVSTVPADCYGGGPVLKQMCSFTAPTDAEGLYDAYCSGCHGNAKKGSSASAIQGAIDSNRGGMSVVNSLTPAQVALIASAK